MRKAERGEVMKTVKVNETTVANMKVSDDGKCLHCPFLRFKMGQPWCSLTDFFDPEIRECLLVDKGLLEVEQCTK